MIYKETEDVVSIQESTVEISRSRSLQFKICKYGACLSGSNRIKCEIHKIKCNRYHLSLPSSNDLHDE